MLATNTERPMCIWPQVSMQDTSRSLLHEQLLEQAIENSLSCAIYPSYKSVSTSRSNALMDGSSLTSDKEVGNINKFPGNRKLSIVLIPAIKSSPQINLLIASPSSAQPHHQPPKKDRRKLHTTWVRKIRRKVDCQSPRNTMQPSQERMVVASTEGAQVNSSKHCLIGSQEKEAVCTLHADRKRKRREEESLLHPDQPLAKRHYVITEEKSQPDLSEKNIDKQINDTTSKASNLPEASSSASASATAHSSGKPSTFSIDDINTGATILTLITEICNNVDGKLSRLEQLDLLDLFEQMPDLMTRERRLSTDSRKMANDFVSTVYKSCGAANWGEIETFDDLKLQLEALTKFGSRAEASPRQEGHVIVL